MLPLLIPRMTMCRFVYTPITDYTPITAPPLGTDEGWRHKRERDMTGGCGTAGGDAELQGNDRRSDAEYEEREARAQVYSGGRKRTARRGAEGRPWYQSRGRDAEGALGSEVGVEVGFA